jgi:hypothetical protein
VSLVSASGSPGGFLLLRVQVSGTDRICGDVQSCGVQSPAHCGDTVKLLVCYVVGRCVSGCKGVKLRVCNIGV